MTLKEFIQANRDLIDRFIRTHLPANSLIDDEERRLWVLNVESLYLQAIEEGVDLT